jgi:general stress protein 26
MVVREKKLSQDEIEAILQVHQVGTLSLAEGDHPYAIQLEYTYHGGALYMATPQEGRKIDYLNKNNRAVFTVFDDRHSHPDMINKKIPCRSVRAEGIVKIVHVKKYVNREGVERTLVILKFVIESMGSWRCTRKVCTLAVGIDNRNTMMEWLQEANLVSG